MEDAHIAQYNIAPDVHIFGVFDGHGGNLFKFRIFLPFSSAFFQFFPSLTAINR